MPNTAADQAVHALGAKTWKRCRQCDQDLSQEILSANHGVCTFCGHHHRISALSHIGIVIDFGTFEELDRSVKMADPIQWEDERRYRDTHAAMQAKLDVDESFIYGYAKIHDRKMLVGSFDFRFFGGTLGCVTGERIARMYERGVEEKLPVVVFTQSGGARMQEGLYSLYQMPKIAAAVRRFQDRGGFCVHILCDPTTGGVAASLSFLGDFVWAEPGALIGFSGPRVIREAIGQELPDDAQRSETLLKNGMVDAVVPRAEQRPRLVELLRVSRGQSPS